MKKEDGKYTAAFAVILAATLPAAAFWPEDAGRAGERSALEQSRNAAGTEAVPPPAPAEGPDEARGDRGGVGEPSIDPATFDYDKHVRAVQELGRTAGDLAARLASLGLTEAEGRALADFANKRQPDDAAPRHRGPRAHQRDAEEAGRAGPAGALSVFRPAPRLVSVSAPGI